MEVSLTFSASLEAGMKKIGHDLEPLEKDLKTYFTTQEKPSYLGKDAPFFRPDNIEESEVHHLHLYIEGISCPNKWEKNKTSDSYIVYTFGYMNEESHYVFAMIHDKAHDKCKDYSYMRSLKHMADEFRDNN